MKSALIAGMAATALLGNAAASGVHDRHQGFHNRRNALEIRNDDGEVCGCTTYVTSITGPATRESASARHFSPLLTYPTSGSHSRALRSRRRALEPRRCPLRPGWRSFGPGLQVEHLDHLLDSRHHRR